MGGEDDVGVGDVGDFEGEVFLEEFVFFLGDEVFGFVGRLV